MSREVAHRMGREGTIPRSVAEPARVGDGAGTLTETVVERIRQDIILGDLPPASRLKLEKLSKVYGASINTLREALSRLAADGLVVAEGQRGFAVLPVSTEDLRDITQMRQLLECHALRQSIEAADLDWEARVVGAYHKLSKVEALVEADPDRYGEQWEQYNHEYHDALISNARSRWLRIFHEAMYNHSTRYRMLSLKTKPFPRAQSAQEHKELLDAALARDADRAVAILAAHILKGAEVASLSEAGKSGPVGRSAQKT
jgi:GntR family transcriptional regulator, carbon starvation induced regulator